MSPVIQPRGPLPARVYWTRRFLLLTLAMLLVVGIARLLGPTGEPAAEQASPAAAPASSAVPSDPSSGATLLASPSDDPSEDPRAKARTDRRKDKGRPTLPEPEGPCDPADVLVTPTITRARESRPIRITLELTTQESRACTWEVAPGNVFVMVSSEDSPLWTSQHCPGVVPTQPVVPRRRHADKVTLWWNGLESDQDCSRDTPWVRAGRYTVTAVARGSVTPIETEFVLRPYERKTVTSSPTPTESPSGPDDEDTGRG